MWKEHIKYTQKGLRLNLNQEASCCEATVLFQIIKKKYMNIYFLLCIYFFYSKMHRDASTDWTLTKLRVFFCYKSLTISEPLAQFVIPLCSL